MSVEKLSLLCALATATLLERPVSAQEASPDDTSLEAAPSGEERPPDAPLGFRVLAFVKLCPGLSLYPGLDEVVQFDVDGVVGGRFELTHGRRSRLELVPELGYTFHAGEAGVGGHYGFVGLGLRYGGSWLAGSTVTALALGSRSGELDLGVRAGLRLEAFLGILGLEVSWEYRTFGGGGDLQAMRVLFLIDAAAVVMPMTLTRMGWEFHRR